MNHNSTAVAVSPRQPNPFYLSVVQSELMSGGVRPADRVLVVCGGDLDRVTLLAAGLENVVITNLALHGGHQDYAPYPWESRDVENLDYPDNSFDVAIVHSGLHHCYNPCRALGELCRVARRQVICFEPYETWFTRLGARLGYGQRYEDSAVFLCGGASGGVANTEIPNFVYRFSEDEVRKFSRVYYPHGEAQVRFYRALRINSGRFESHRNGLIRRSFKVAAPALTLLAHLVPSMNNNLAFVIARPGPEHFHPWIKELEGQVRVDLDYLARKYSAKNG
jgi:SAM-dependent methyltransferase